MIKSTKQAGPGYAMTLSRCAVEKRHLSLNYTTKSKRQAAV